MDNRSTLDPIGHFLNQAEGRLQGRLAPSRLTEALEEAREHLTQRTEEMTAAGLEPKAAAAASVAAFGPAREWARAILIAADTAPGARLLRTVSVTAFTIFLMATPVWLFINFGTADDHNSLLRMMLPMAVALAALLVALAGVFCARRCPVPGLSGVIAAAAAVTFLLAGSLFFSTPHRAMVSRRDQAAYRALVSQVHLLRLGNQTYAGSALPPGVPGALKTPDGYLAPMWRPTGGDIAAVGPDGKPMPGEQLEMHLESVPTEELAAQQWHRFGNRPTEADPPDYVEAEAALQAAPPFTAAVGAQVAAATAAEGLVGLALCWGAAQMGLLFRRRPQGRQTA